MDNKSIYDIFKDFRHADNNYERILNEDELDYGHAQDEDSVPYKSNDDLLTSSMETAKSQFGADFSDIKAPMVYYPSNDDITFSGKIGSLNGAKFQFRYKDPSNEGCFIWINPLQLTENNLDVLKRIYGVFKNWKNELDITDDKKPISIKNRQ